MSKEEIIDELDIYTVGRLKSSQVCITVEELSNIIDEISKLPTIKYGHWIKGESWIAGYGMGEQYGYTYSCSECNNKVRYSDDVCRVNFCSNCGANMRKE